MIPSPSSKVEPPLQLFVHSLVIFYPCISTGKTIYRTRTSRRFRSGPEPQYGFCKGIGHPVFVFERVAASDDTLLILRRYTEEAAKTNFPFGFRVAKPASTDSNLSRYIPVKGLVAGLPLIYAEH
jgi:hypothetical protein